MTEKTIKFGEQVMGRGGQTEGMSKKGSLMRQHLNQDLKTMRDKNHRGLWEVSKTY